MEHIVTCAVHIGAQSALELGHFSCAGNRGVAVHLSLCCAALPGVSIFGRAPTLVGIPVAVSTLALGHLGGAWCWRSAHVARLYSLALESDGLHLQEELEQVLVLQLLKVPLCI